MDFTLNRIGIKLKNMPTVENCEYTEVRSAAGPISWYAGEGIGGLVVSVFFYWRNLSSFFMAKLAARFPGEDLGLQQVL